MTLIQSAQASYLRARAADRCVSGRVVAGRARIGLALDGREQDTGRITATPSGFSIDETFDIGQSGGSPVGDYPHRYRFTGRLEEADVELR